MHEIVAVLLQPIGAKFQCAIGGTSETGKVSVSWRHERSIDVRHMNSWHGFASKRGHAPQLLATETGGQTEGCNGMIRMLFAVNVPYIACVQNADAHFGLKQKHH